MEVCHCVFLFVYSFWFLVLMEHSLTLKRAWVPVEEFKVLILILMEKMNTQSQRAGGYLPFFTKVGNKSENGYICMKFIRCG